MSKPKIHTMKDLSKAIGISRPTLARYFEDKDSVLPSTAQKIQAGLAGVDYVYNFLATRQNRKSTGLIGVVIPHFEDLFYASLLESIERATRDAGFTMITQSSQGALSAQDRAIGKLRSMTVDGAVIAPLGTGAHSDAIAAAIADFPIVFVDSHPSDGLADADFVGTDNHNSMGVMIEYLCRTGPPPVFLAMPRLNSNADERQAAYFRQMNQRSLSGACIAAPENAETWEFERYGYEVMNGHFAQGRYVDATILCANDRIAIGALRAANTHGLFLKSQGAKGQLRIAGHDDHPLSRYMHPALTTVAQSVDSIGQGAVRLLVDRIQNGREGAGKKVLLDGALKVRDSA